MKYFTIKYLVAGTDSILKLCFSIVFFVLPYFSSFVPTSTTPLQGEMSQNIACLTLVFLTQVFSDLDHGQPGHHGKKKCRHLILSLHYSSY